MTEEDMNRVREDFGKAAQMARESGFDAVEIHAGHGYLLSQFLSPWTNGRKDQYGGSLENRMRFPASVIEHVRKVMGPDYPILVKMNTEDGFKNGITIDEAVQVAKRFEQAGASALIPSCGFTAKTSFHMMRGNLPKKEYIKYEKNIVTKIGLQLFAGLILKIVPFEEMFLFDLSKQIKNAVKIPVVYVGGVCSLDNMKKVMDEGFEFLELGRATIKDPDFVNRLIAGEITASDCDHCNKCVAEMSGPNGVKCVCNELAAAGAATK
jgi:2,4-dienoyl-CoA reductase-like NADH-dependent reductase (Old Yellow Enzyme family)